MSDHCKDYFDLPVAAVEFIDRVVKSIRYRRKVRLEVRDELFDHFCLGLSECSTVEEKEAGVKEMIEEFGDIKMLATLIRRGKKRCRPLWKKVFIRSLQGVCVFVLCFILYSFWFFTGKPNPTVDYLAVFNEYAKPEISDESNAWPYYEKAISLYVEPDEKINNVTSEFTGLSEEERSLIGSWVEANGPAWGNMRQVRKCLIAIGSMVMVEMIREIAG